MLRTLFAYILNQSAPPHSDFTVMSSAVRITILIPDQLHTENLVLGSIANLGNLPYVGHRHSAYSHQKEVGVSLFGSAITPHRSYHNRYSQTC